MTDTYIKELTTDLYYDLLEKYVALQADYKILKDSYRNIKCELSIYKEYCTVNPDIIAGTWNKRIDTILGIIHHHKNDRGAILNKITNLKIIIS